MPDELRLITYCKCGNLASVNEGLGNYDLRFPHLCKKCASGYSKTLDRLKNYNKVEENISDNINNTSSS